LSNTDKEAVGLILALELASLTSSWLYSGLEFSFLTIVCVLEQIITCYYLLFYI